MSDTPTSYLREGPEALPPLDYEAYKPTRLQPARETVFFAL